MSCMQALTQEAQQSASKAKRRAARCNKAQSLCVGPLHAHYLAGLCLTDMFCIRVHSCSIHVMQQRKQRQDLWPQCTVQLVWSHLG